MSDRDSGSPFVQNRRQFLGNAAAVGGAGLLPGAIALSEAASAQGASDTLVIAAPATPQGLDIEFDVSLGSIDTLGAIYEYMLGYEKMADPNAPGVLREDTGVHADKPNGLALKGKLAESWELTPDGRKATFKLREGVKSNWGNPFTAKDVKWTWDRKFNLKGQGIFQTSVLGLHTPDQIKIEGDHAISFNLDKPNPILLKQQCNLANPIYDGTKCAEVGRQGRPLGGAVPQERQRRVWPLPIEAAGARSAGRVRGARRLLGRQACDEARHHEGSADIGEPALVVAGRRGRHRSVPSTARAAVAQRRQRGGGRLQSTPPTRSGSSSTPPSSRSTMSTCVAPSTMRFRRTRSSAPSTTATRTSRRPPCRTSTRWPTLRSSTTT